ncbi:phage tail protein [Lactococcus lactis]|uniref:Uncharacterized protein n=1 Tax=Lactococcus lactis subsp. lactis TaxID=1360 RepID=A0A2R7Y000_LACLL|nr:phage tail protein [Lactococcus lactis]PUA16129.1 hypothetical protein CYU10_000293 [Lactococcus lactis subsp. lactis]
MQITIHDNQMNRVGFLSNEVPGLPSFFNDNWHRYLAEGAATFDFSVNKFKNGALQDYCQFLNDQAYISFTYEGEDFLFSVLTSEETDDVITLNTATLNLELRNEQANPLVNSSGHNIQWYFDQMQLISNAQITIGINEVSNLTRTISYDGQESKLARLLSVIGNFDAEFEFVTDLNDDGTLKGISLNIYKANDGASVQGVGTWRNDVTLYFGKNISGVRRTIDRTQIFNATTVTGAEGLNWNSSEWSVKNADGVEEFYKRKGSNTAFAPLSAELYPSQIKSSTGDFWIRKDFETEYKSANEMWGYALSQFKKYAYALVTYEVSAKSKLVSQAVGDGQALSIGDTVRIQDENFNAQTGGLILQARVSELEISFSNPSNNKLTFSNYVELESGISDDLEARLAQLIKDSTPYRPDITSTNGTQFKNGTGTTTLGAHIYFGSDTTETVADSYEWSKDGTVVANVQEIIVDASGVVNKAVYSFKATVAGKVVASQSVTITNVNDGTNGRSVTNVSQKWRLTTTSTAPTQAWSDTGWLTTQPTTTATNKYLWSITRTTFNLAPLTQDVIEQKAVYGDKGGDGIAGKDGVGLKTTVITYAISTNGTIAPTTGWTSSVPSLVKGQYLWTKTVWAYTDNSSETGYSVTYISKDGNDGGDGFPGKDGVGIKTTTITYAGSTSGTTAPTSGWTATVPTVAAGSYLWTKTVWAYTDNTSETGYSVAKMGNTGADGKTSYTHTAWSYSADGTNGFTTVYPNLNLEQHTKMLVDKNDKLLWGSKGSATATMTYDTLTIPETLEVIDAVRTTQTTTGQSGWRSPNGSNGGSYSVTPGEKISISAYVRNNTSNTLSISLQLGVSANINQSSPKYLLNTVAVPGDGKVHLITGTLEIPAGYNFAWSYVYSLNGTTSADFTFGRLKVEHGSTATPHMPSSSEVTTADWPSYIGQYTDFTQADSTNPSDYTWSLIRGNDGADGQDGKDGTNGTDGDPGKVVSDTEPTTRFKGLTWKYSGTADLTASDGTVIKQNTEYYYNGTKWLINLIEANQLNVNELAAISAYLGHVYAAIVEDKQSDGSGFLLDSEKQLLRVNKTANTYNQIFSEGLTTFAKISDLPGIGNIIPGANYISAILAGNFLQFGQYSTAVDSNGVPVGGVSVGEGSISFGQTTSGSYGFTLTGDLTVAGNIKSLKDTDWIDIPPASGWGGIMRYMIAEGKFYLRLTGVTNPAVPAATARTMCTIPTTAVPLGGIRGIPIMSYGQPIAELVINANGTVQFYPNAAVGTGQSLHVFVQGIPLT